MGDWRSDAKPPGYYDEKPLGGDTPSELDHDDNRWTHGRVPYSEDAALAEIKKLTAERDALQRQLWDTVERWTCDSHPWTDGSGDPVTNPDEVRRLTDAALEDAARLLGLVTEARVLMLTTSGRTCGPEERDWLDRAALTDTKGVGGE